MATRIEVVADRTHETPSDKGFLKVRRLLLRNHYDDGTRSDEYKYDAVDRDALDAVVIVLYAPREGAPLDPWVCFRTALRPPVGLRANRPGLPLPEPGRGAVLWEMPAGLIEKDEVGERGVRACAARETEEETGFALSADDFALLGPGAFLSPGMSGEKLFFAVARVDRDKKGTATEDGSPVEAKADVTFWALEDALARAARGELEDIKTELALHRLRAHLAAKRT